jgi:diacylglycerol kinase family enzyme
MACASTLAGSDVALAVLPRGTGNLAPSRLLKVTIRPQALWLCVPA